MYVTPREAAQVGDVARRVGGYEELCRLSELYLAMKRRGKIPEITRIEGVWVVREKGVDHA